MVEVIAGRGMLTRTFLEVLLLGFLLWLDAVIVAAMTEEVATLSLVAGTAIGVSTTMLPTSEVATV